MPALIVPVFIQVALTFALMFWMGAARTACIRRGEASFEDVALANDIYDAKTRAIGAAFHNQFELPVLFYVVVALSLATGAATHILAGLAWVFVLMRIAHAYIHVTTNFVPRRFLFFLGSALALIAMWLVFGVAFILNWDVAA